MAIMVPSQGTDEGSIPFTRSKNLVKFFERGSPHREAMSGPLTNMYFIYILSSSKRIKI